MSDEEPKVIVFAVDDFGSIARRLAELQEEAERNRRIFEQLVNRTPSGQSGGQQLGN